METTKGEHRNWSQVLSLLPIYLLQFCYGMNSGYPAIMTPQLKEGCSGFDITDDQESWIVSIDNAATPIVCIFSGYIQHLIGPKKVLMLTCFPYIGGWALAAIATDVWHLYVSRLLVGVSHAFVTTTVYTVEITSKDMRGTYSLWESVLRCSGCLTIYALGYFFRWDEIAHGAPAVPILAILICLVAPQSPVFLVKSGKHKGAQRSLKRLHGPNFNAAKEASVIKQNLDHLEKKNKEHDANFWLRLIRRPEIYKPFGIIVVLSFVQQFSGMSIIRAYVVKIFDDIFSSGEGSSNAVNRTARPVPFLLSMNNNGSNSTDCEPDPTSDLAYLSAVVIGATRLVSSLLLSGLLIRYHRRTMYFFSATLTILSLGAFASATLVISLEIKTDLMAWLSLVAASAIVFAVQLGVQTLPNLLSGELFPCDLRAMCKSACRSITSLLLIACLKSYPLLENALGMYGTFYLFAGIITIFLPVIYLILPETKDMKLEMIQNHFVKHKRRFTLDLIRHHTHHTEHNNNNNNKC